MPDTRSLCNCGHQRHEHTAHLHVCESCRCASFHVTCSESCTCIDLNAYPFAYQWSSD